MDLEELKVIYRHYRVPHGYAKRCGKPRPSDVFPYRRGVGFYLSNGVYPEPPEVRGGLTGCVITSGDNELLGMGIAWCSFSDNFCYKAGREIALVRAMKEANLYA